MSEQYIPKIEQNEELVKVIEFLIKDNAFDKDFILTTILEYITNSGEIKSLLP